MGADGAGLLPVLGSCSRKEHPMSLHAPPKAGALLLAGVLVLLAAAPAAAGPHRATAEEPSLFEAFTAWLAAWLPDAAPASGLTPVWDFLGPEGDPDGTPASTGDDPTATPQLGIGADPTG
jgi:hypothetical protein